MSETLRGEGGSSDAIAIRVVAGADSICDPCPNRLGNSCSTEARIEQLDRAHSSILGLQAGNVLTWGEARLRLARRMTVEARRSACAPCAWKWLGLCEKALRKPTEEGQK